MQDYSCLNKYKARKTKGVISTAISTEPALPGMIVVTKKAFDDDGDLLPDRVTVLVTTKEAILKEIDRLQALKKMLNDFLLEEGL